jgi:hypothetical protein
MSTGTAADDRGDRIWLSVAYQVNDKSILGNTSDDFSSQMVAVRIPVMPLKSSHVIPCHVLSIQHVPEGEINGRHEA